MPAHLDNETGIELRLDTCYHEFWFPGPEWTSRSPEQAGIRAEFLDSIARLLGGSGCIVYQGRMVKEWGNIQKRSDWMSSVKPLFSTFLFFAVESGIVSSVEEPVAGYGWDLQGSDRDITFFHLANMTSGYARPEGPGEAWAYNDYAIQLYQKCLFEKVFISSAQLVLDSLLSSLAFQDQPRFREDKPRLYASVRDFARIGWFWLNKGRWNDRQLLPRHYFDLYMRPHVPGELPHTAETATDDYLEVGTFGGGSDHFTRFGPGIYGFNWWFNATGRDHPGTLTWPDAPSDAVMAIGAGGNNMVLFPGEDLLLSSSGGAWGDMKAGDTNSRFNRVMKWLLQSVSYVEATINQNR